MIDIRIMAHPKRKSSATKLRKQLERMPFDNVQVVFDKNKDEWETGKRAWNLPSESPWLCVVQDDCIISDTFYYNLSQALMNAPEESIVSLYLGTSRPHPTEIKAAIKEAKEKKASWISSKQLHHGVGFCLKTELIEPIFTQVENVKDLNYDNRIGFYFQMRNRPVYYTNPQLVDHDDSMPSLSGHDFNIEKRVAHNFIGENIHDGWADKKVIKVRA